MKLLTFLLTAMTLMSFSFVEAEAADCAAAKISANWCMSTYKNKRKCRTSLKRAASCSGSTVSSDASAKKSSGRAYKNYTFRSGPGEKFKRVAKGKGGRFSTTDKAVILDDCPKGWCKVRIAGKGTGFVKKKSFGPKFKLSGFVEADSADADSIATASDKASVRILGKRKRTAAEDKINKADIKPRMNLGFIQRSKSSGFDTNSIADSMKYFKNSCDKSDKKLMPCSPALGVKSDGSMFCSKANTTSSCIEASRKNKGLKNLRKIHRAANSEERAKIEADLKKVKSPLVAHCGEDSKCTSVAKFIGQGPDIGHDPLAVEEIAGNRKKLPPVYSGEDSCKASKNFMNKGRLSDKPVIKNVEPKWEALVNYASVLCGKSAIDIYKIAGACPKGTLSGSDAKVSNKLTNGIALVGKKGQRPPSPSLFKNSFKMSASQVKTAFCGSSDTASFLKNIHRANNKLAVRRNTEPIKWPAEVKRNEPIWASQCLNSGMINIKKKYKKEQDLKCKVKDDGTTDCQSPKANEIIGTNVSKAKTPDANKCLKPIGISVDSIRNKGGKLFLIAKNPKGGHAKCMIMATSKLYSESFQLGREKKGLPRIKNHVKLSVPVGKELGKSYQYDFKDIDEVSKDFKAYRWDCSEVQAQDITITNPDSDGEYEACVAIKNKKGMSRNAAERVCGRKTSR